MASNYPPEPATLRETPLSRALRRIAKGKRMSSLNVPFLVAVLDDAADEIDRLDAALRAERGMAQERAIDPMVRGHGDGHTISDVNVAPHYLHCNETPPCRVEDGRWYPCKKHQPHPAALPGQEPTDGK
jgi:hypothetical protein